MTWFCQDHYILQIPFVHWFIKQFSYQGFLLSLHLKDNDPDCQSNIKPDGVIGQNKFNITPDEVQLTCTVTYHGNIPPALEWKKIGDCNATDDSAASPVIYDNRLIYNLNLKGHSSLDNSSYVCQTKKSTQNQYKCISKKIKVLCE